MSQRVGGVLEICVFLANEFDRLPHSVSTMKEP